MNDVPEYDHSFVMKQLLHTIEQRKKAIAEFDRRIEELKAQIRVTQMMMKEVDEFEFRDLKNG